MNKIKNLSDVKAWLSPWVSSLPSSPQPIADSNFDARYVNHLFGLLFPKRDEMILHILPVEVSIINEPYILKGDIQQFLEKDKVSAVLTFYEDINGELICQLQLDYGQLASPWNPIPSNDYGLQIDNLLLNYNPVKAVVASEYYQNSTPIINLSYNTAEASLNNLKLPNIGVTIPSLGGEWILDAGIDKKKPLAVSAEDLKKLLADYSIIEKLLVNYFEVQNFKMTNFSMRFLPNELRCYKIWVGLEYDSSWNLWDNRFVVENLFFSLTLFNPFPTPPQALQAKIGANMKVGNQEIDVTVLFDYDITTKVTSSSVYADIHHISFNIKEVFNFFHVPLPIGFPEENIEIDTLSFVLFPQDKVAEIDLGITSPFHIAGTVLLENFYFKLGAQYEDHQVNPYGEINTKFVLGDTDLVLSGNYQSKDSWLLISRFGGLHAGTIITDIASKFGIATNAIPSVIKSVELDVLETSYTHGTDQSVFAFSLEGTTQLAGIEIDFAPKIQLTHIGNEWNPEFLGSLAFLEGDHTYTFDISINQENNQLIIAHYTDNNNLLSLSSLCSIFGFSTPSSLDVTFTDVQFDYSYAEDNQWLSLSASSEKYQVYLYTFKKDNQWIRVFGMNLQLSIGLSGLPIVGGLLNGEVRPIEVQMLYASQALPKAETRDIPDNIGLPDNSNGFLKGLSFLGKVIFTNSDKTYIISSNFEQESGEGTVPQTSSTSEIGSTGQAPMGRTIGPVHIENMDMNFNNGRLIFNVNGSLTMGNISLSFEGLQFSNPINEFAPSFNLDGLGISYSKNDIQIGGAFLRDHADGVEEYNGLINIGIKELQLMAMGSYAKVKDDPSFFIYDLLNFPIGGLPFFYITGLATGIGYNRNLLLPSISDVSNFPLVEKALLPLPATPVAPIVDATTEILAQLGNDVPISLGSYFFGVGVKLTSFKIIDSFALMVLKLKKELEVDIIGVSRYVSPSPYDPAPVAVVELEFMGLIIPSQGYAILQGQLTSASFVFSRNCHLSGGYAAAVWTQGEHAGNFVYSYGGYGHVQPDAYYPSNIPALELLWLVNNQVSVKGGGYWTITSKFITAGGYLNATFNTDWVRAWFDLDASFIIDWKPFHYQGTFHVDMGASVKVDLLFFHKWISVDVSAELTVSGPDFSGHAEIHLWIVSFGVKFGLNPSPPAALNWKEFANSFLPDTDDKILQLNVTKGLGKKVVIDSVEWSIINAKDLEIQAQSMIPASDCSVLYNTTAGDHITVIGSDNASDAGISAMDIQIGQFDAPLTLTITPNVNQEEHQVEANIILENTPAAMWGDGFEAKTAANSVIADTRKGIRINAKPAQPKHTTIIDRQELAWDWQTFSNVYQWGQISTSFQSEKTSNIIPFGNPQPQSDHRRNKILKQLGVSADEITNDDIIFDEDLMIGIFS